MLDCSKKALIRMFLKHLLNLANRTPHVPIIILDFEETSNPITSAQEEADALMTEGFGPSTSLGQGLINYLPGRDIPNLPLSTPLRETLGSDVQLGQCGVSDQEVETLTFEYRFDQAIYRVFTTLVAGRMSTFFIPIPIAHFQVGLHVPLDIAFVDILTFAQAQPAQIHPNAVQNIMSLIFLCLRHGVEVTPALLQNFSVPLRMVDNLLSLL